MRIWIYILLATCFLEFLDYRNSKEGLFILGIPIVIINLPSVFASNQIACVAYTIYRIVLIVQSHKSLKNKFLIGYVASALFAIVEASIILFGI